MTFLVKDTTDNKYEGLRLQLDKIPLPGDIFEMKDVSFKIENISIKDENEYTIFSENYIVVLLKV